MADAHGRSVVETNIINVCVVINTCVFIYVEGIYKCHRTYIYFHFLLSSFSFASGVRAKRRTALVADS